MTGPRHADRPSHTEGSALDPDALEVAPGTLHETVQGWVPKLATEEELRIALEKAFDYRGDVTVTLKDNSRIEGYLFDRVRSEEHTSELQSRRDLVCRLLLEKKNNYQHTTLA